MSIDEKIIQIFHRALGGYVSGEDIANNLNVSRTAVWNHIEKLKQIGYDFEAIPHLGYRLVHIPDKLLPDEIAFGLKTEVIGKKIVLYDSTSSTNNIAYRMALDGADEGTVVLAEYQEHGKGRMNRIWYSPHSKNILLSVVLRPHIEPYYAPLITIMSAVSVAFAIRECTALWASIKWPNDVLVNGKKVAGSLLEQKTELDKVDFIIIGIGINANMDQCDLSKEIKRSATSLKILKGEKIDRINLVKKLLFFLEKKYIMIKNAQHDDIIKEWIDLSCSFGKRIIVKHGKNRLEGVAVGIEQNGSLLLKDDSGVIHNVLSGDLEIH